MQVNASVDEADIGNIADVEDVQFTVDAYPTGISSAGSRNSPRADHGAERLTYSVIVNVTTAAWSARMTANIRITVAAGQRPRGFRTRLCAICRRALRATTSAPCWRSPARNAERRRACSSQVKRHAGRDRQCDAALL
jgi:hypothetical protein